MKVNTTTSQRFQAGTRKEKHRKQRGLTKAVNCDRDPTHGWQRSVKITFAPRAYTPGGKITQFSYPKTTYLECSVCWNHIDRDGKAARRDFLQRASEDV